MRPAHPTTRPSRLVLAALGALVAPLLAACGSGSGSSQSDDGPAAEGFPRTVETCFGDVVVEDRPERIVSLNQGSTEILLSLGLADRMAGAATWTDPILPSLAEENEKVERLSENSPSLETVLAQEPDLVTASFTGTLGEGGVATSGQLAETYGLPSYLSAAECGKQESGNTDGTREGTLEMADIYTEVRQLAELTGVEEGGEQLVADLEQRMADASVEVEPGISVAYWFANSESPYLAGCCGGPGIVSRTLGVDNVFVDQTDEWPQINWEVVADADPDVLVIGDLTRKSQTAETAAAKIEFLESHPVTSKMTAVQEGRYIHLAGAELNPSIRTVDAVEKVAQGLRDLGLTS